MTITAKMTQGQIVPIFWVEEGFLGRGSGFISPKLRLTLHKLGIRPCWFSKKTNLYQSNHLIIIIVYLSATDELAELVKTNVNAIEMATSFPHTGFIIFCATAAIGILLIIVAFVVTSKAQVDS